MSTTTNLSSLKINYLTQAQYETALAGGNINENEIYMTPSSGVELIDIFYPVGSYYETSNASFNPNIAWGGTWEREAQGLVHIGSGDRYISGTTGGAETVTLTLANVGVKNSSAEASGYGLTATSVFQNRVMVDASTVSAHNNMQPYIVVNRWHRTA